MIYSMAGIEGVLARNRIYAADIAFNCWAAMHVNDEIFAAAKQGVVKVVHKAVFHL